MTSVMQARQQGKHPPVGGHGLNTSSMNIQYIDLMGIGKNLSMVLKTGISKLVSFVTWLYWLVVGNVGTVSDHNHVAESPKRMKTSESLPDIATKVTHMNGQEAGEVAECPLTPVIAHQDTTPVSRRGSPQREKSVEISVPKIKKTNTFVMVEYRDGSDTVGFREKTSPYDDSPSSATHTDTTNPKCLKDSTLYDTPVGQQYVVVEVPRDGTEMKKKKKKKKRAKGKKEDQGKNTQPVSCDQIEKKSSNITTPLCGQGVGMELGNTPESNTCAASLDADIGFLKSSTDSNMVPISNNIFSSGDSVDTRASCMNEQHHESELEKAWKTASLAAAKLGLDTFGEDTSLIRQSSHPIDTSDSMNSSRLSHLSWGTSMESSLSFGSPLHSTSGKKSSSFKNIKDIWEKSA